MAVVLSKKSAIADWPDLPRVNKSMALDFFKDSSNEKFAEMKTKAYLQKNNEIATVDDIGVIREGSSCKLKASVCTDQKNNKRLVVTSIDEEKQVINNLRCINCAHGGCEHALALLLWLQKKSDEEARSRLPNSTKQVVLTEIGFTSKIHQTNKQNLQNKDQSAVARENKSNLVKQVVANNDRKNSPKNNKNIKDAFAVLKENQLKASQTKSKKNVALVSPTAEKQRYKKNLQSLYNAVPSPTRKEKKPINYLFEESILELALNGIASQCVSKGIRTVEGFLAFAKIKMDESLCRLAERETRQQSESSLWHKLRCGRITASKMHEASRCKTENGRLVQEILGLTESFETYYMKRGKDLEAEVFNEVIRQGHKVEKCGFFLHADYPYLGASPDGIGKDFVLEIKCPGSQKTFENYLRDGKITTKYRAQVLLQMFLTGKQKGLFCVAHYDFETNKKIYFDWVDFDEEEMTTLVAKVSTFWKNNIYPRLC